MMDIFSVLLQWLASGSGDEAKNRSVPILDFPMPDLAPSSLDTSGGRPMPRLCCALGGDLSPSLNPQNLWNEPHQYRHVGGLGFLPGGGASGYVYTRHGGFIDLGHARDLVDWTRYFTQKYRDAASLSIYAAGMSLFNEGADVFLIAEQVTPRRDLAMCALFGAKLAFDFSIWHEIVTYFPQTSGIDQKYSSFSPEDVFSNAVGVVAGFKALMHPEGGFDVAADRALKEVLELLGPAMPETTDAAMMYVKDRWWESSMFPNPMPSALRRNFMPRGPIQPWLVTDLDIPGRQAQSADLKKTLSHPSAASITIPTHHNGIFLESQAHLVFKNPLQEIKDLVPTMSEIRSIDLLNVSSKLRDLARAQESALIDQP